MSKRVREKAEQDRVLEEVIQTTRNQMKEISFSYEKLSHILKKMPKREWGLQEEEVFHILGRTSVEACEECGHFYQCYRKDKKEVVEEVRQMLSQIEKSGIGGKIKIPAAFEERCLRKERFLEALFQSYEIIGINRSWQNKMLYQRKVMASQMEEMSRILFDCSAVMGYDKKGEDCWEKVLRKWMKRENIILSYIRFYENAGKRKEVFLMARSRRGSCPVQRVAGILTSVLKVPMAPARECRLAVYEETALFHFTEDVNFRVLTGITQAVKDGEEVSGDLFSVIRLEKGKEIFLLADGMGSGEKAMEEGKQTLELMEQLLDTGFHEEETLRLANSAITFGVERTMYSSLDLLSFNLFTGVMKIIKAGSAATFIVRKERIEILRSKTLPTGFLWEVEFDVVYKKLYDGDSIILVSDGILDSVSEGEPEEILKEFIEEIRGENPKQTADKIMDWAVSESGGNRRDDMSVMVLHIWKKNHSIKKTTDKTGKIKCLQQ